MRETSCSSAAASPLPPRSSAAILIAESGLRRSWPTMATRRSRSAAASSARAPFRLGGLEQLRVAQGARGAPRQLFGEGQIALVVDPGAGRREDHHADGFVRDARSARGSPRRCETCGSRPRALRRRPAEEATPPSSWDGARCVPFARRDGREPPAERCPSVAARAGLASSSGLAACVTASRGSPVCGSFRWTSAPSEKAGTAMRAMAEQDLLGVERLRQQARSVGEDRHRLLGVLERRDVGDGAGHDLGAPLRCRTGRDRDYEANGSPRSPTPCDDRSGTGVRSRSTRRPPARPGLGPRDEFP